MRIALVNLTSGGLSGGYRKYLEIVPPMLARHPDVSSLEVLSPEAMTHSLGSELRQWRWPAGDARQGYRALRSHLDAAPVDVVFFPTARMVRSVHPTVVMVRNMEPLVAPFTGNSLIDGARNVARRLAAHASCRRADRVIAVSDFVRDFVVERWKIRSDKIGVVPHGIEAPASEREWVRPAALSLPGGGAALFTAGSIRPSRGLEDAIDALAILRSGGTQATLWIAGRVAGDASRYHRRLRRSIAARGLEDRVQWLGALTRAEMSWCFAHCDAFLMTSRVEACPNIALEAMSYGARCVATTNRPMPETFERTAAYYEAGDASGLAESARAQLALGDADRAALAEVATARAGEFTWERTVDDTVRELELARRRPR